MDFLKIADQIVKFESLLLRNSMKMDVLLDRIGIVEKNIQTLGKCTQKAFNQTKIVVNELCERQKDLTENLDSYGGVIQSSTWIT